jgi:porphobilinogen synthase
MNFPATRLRRLRATPALRAMTRETSLAAGDLVAPLFVCPGERVRRPIASMPGHAQLSVDEAAREAAAIAEAGVGGIILFGIPSTKDPEGREAYDEKGIVPRALRALKAAAPGLLLWADVCLCEYTDHGHCGVLNGDRVDNDRTLPLLARAAVAYAAAGADLIAPSDMMDGRVGAVRRGLDEAGFAETPIVAYSAKYASAFYGPFREAAESTPQFGDRRGYQMDPANAAEALREVALDLEEGADMVMVKPALPYLDVIRRVKEQFQVPVAAYNVSGEYAMIKAAAQNGWLDGERAALLPTLLWADLTNVYVWIAVIVTAAFGGVGFADDYLKIVRRSHHGLRPRYKLLAQVLIAVLVGLTLIELANRNLYSTRLIFPFFKHFTPSLVLEGFSNSPYLYLVAFMPFLLFISFVMVGSSNTVNLTDGLDGLAIGCVIIASGALTVLTYATGHGRFASYLDIQHLPQVSEATIFCGALVGASLGFLWLGTIPLTSGLVGYMFGPTHMSMLWGIVFFSHQLGSFLGGWGAGRLYDIQGNYDLMWWISVGLGIFAAVIHWCIREQPVPRLATSAVPA